MLHDKKAFKYRVLGLSPLRALLVSVLACIVLSALCYVWNGPTQSARQESRIVKLIQSLDTPDAEDSLVALSELIEIGPTALPFLVDALDAKSQTLRERVAGVLANMGPSATEAAPVLLFKLGEGNCSAGFRVEASDALSKMAPLSKKAYFVVSPVFLDILENENAAWSMRALAAHGLGRFGALAQQAVPLLEKMRTEDPCDSARNAAEEALVHIRSSGQGQHLEGTTEGSSKAPDESRSFAGYKPKSALAHRYVIQWPATGDARAMAAVLDWPRWSQRKPDGMRADLNLDGRLDPKEELVRRGMRNAWEYQTAAVPLMDANDPTLRASLRTLVEKKGNSFTIRLYPTLHMVADNGDKWSYTFNINEWEAKRVEPGIAQIDLGPPAKWLLNFEFCGNTFFPSSTYAQSRGGIEFCHIEKNGKTVRPHFELIDPSGEKIIDKDLDYG